MHKYNFAGSTQNIPSNRQTTSQQRVARDSSKKKTKKVETYPLYIPSNLDLDDLLSRHPIHVPNARDKLIYLLHLIHAVPAFYKEDNIELDNGFTILYSPYLQSAVDEYAILLRWLKNHSIIEIDNGYVLEERSTGYRFSLKYRTEVKKVHITTWTLIRRIIGDKVQRIRHPYLIGYNLYNISPEEEKHVSLGYKRLAIARLSYLKKWFNENLAINEGLALEYLNEQLNGALKGGAFRFPMRKFNCAKMNVESFTNPSPRFTVDDTTGRLHTYLTCLKSELRAFLRYDGKQLAAVDIKNSQPVLSLVFLDEKLFEKNKMKERIGIYNYTWIDRYIDIYIRLGDLIKNNSKNPDALKYKELVLSGELYLWFGKRLQELGILGYGLSEGELRTIAKKGLLKSLFNRNQAIGYERIQWAFKKVFPSVYEIFQFVKMKNHKTLACVLQNLEAEIVLHKACSELALTYPEMPLFTVHDSVASTSDNIGKIKEVLSKYLFEALEQEVKLKDEPWDESLIEEKKTPASFTELESPVLREDNSGTPLYGYYDYELLYVPYYTSLTKAAKQLDLKRNKFMEGLRKLNIISEFNLPTTEFEEAKLFLPNEYSFKVKRGRTLKLFSTKVTDEGFEFLKQLVEDNPDLFPKKRVRIKKP